MLAWLSFSSSLGAFGTSAAGMRPPLTASIGTRHHSHSLATSATTTTPPQRQCCGGTRVDDPKLWLLLLGYIVVPAVWTLFVRIFPKVLGESFIRRIHHGYDVALEKVKAELQERFSTLESSVTFLAASQSELQSKRIESVALLWQACIAAKKEFSDAVFMYDIIHPTEIAKFFENDDVRLDRIVGQYRSMDNFHEKLERVNAIATEEARLFAGDRLWLLFYHCRAFHGRIGLLVSKSFEDSRFYDWRSDQLIGEQLESILPRAIIRKAITENMGGSHTVTAHLEAEFLKEATRVMSGSKAVSESLEDIGSSMAYALAEARSKRSERDDEEDG